MRTVYADMPVGRAQLAAFVALALSLSCGDGNGSQSAATNPDASANGGAGGAADAAPSVCVYDDAGRLPSEAKACMIDDDCNFAPTYSCCGPGLIVGLAKNAAAYRSCFQTSPPQGCPPLGCASQAQTEDRQQAPFAPINLAGVIVRCVATDGGARACMTSYDADAGDR